MKTFSAVLALLIFSAVVPACSCVDMGMSIEETVKGQLNSASAVFEGKAIEYLDRKGTDRLYITFAVDRVWKGEVFPEFELDTDMIRTQHGPVAMNSCEYPFEKGMTYVVFARKTDKGWVTGDCSGTTQVKGKDWDQAVLKALGPGKQKTDHKQK